MKIETTMFHMKDEVNSCGKLEPVFSAGMEQQKYKCVNCNVIIAITRPRFVEVV